MDATAIADRDARHVFTALLERHRGIVFKVAGTYARNAADREDLAQEIAAQLWRAWPRYDPARGSATTWMYRVALNVGISFLRGDGHRRSHSVPLDDALHEVPDPAGDDHGRRDRIRLLQDFIDTLPALDRALLLLYLEERSTRDIAEVLGITESNTTTRLSRLRQRLREHATRRGFD
jgi:RNA polymerase sigma factor (sigma-70 family)